MTRATYCCHMNSNSGGAHAGNSTLGNHTYCAMLSGRTNRNWFHSVLVKHVYAWDQVTRSSGYILYL